MTSSVYLQKNEQLELYVDAGWVGEFARSTSGFVVRLGGAVVVQGGRRLWQCRPVLRSTSLLDPGLSYLGLLETTCGKLLEESGGCGLLRQQDGNIGHGGQCIKSTQTFGSIIFLLKSSHQERKSQAVLDQNN